MSAGFLQMGQEGEEVIGGVLFRFRTEVLATLCSAVAFWPQFRHDCRMSKPFFSLLLMVGLLSACRDSNLQQHQNVPPVREPACGDAHLDPGEACDGSDLGGATCVSLGFESGSLTCASDCHLVTARCVNRCGNGVLDPGEACDGKLGPLTCDTWGYKQCSDQCTVETSHCVLEPFAAGPALDQPEGGKAILTDLAPHGSGDLVTAVPGFLRLNTFAYSKEQGLVAGRKLSFNRVALEPLAGDFDGDGEVDLAAINADGTVDRYPYVSATNSFRVESFPTPDGGSACGAERWVGTGKLHPGGAIDAVAIGCADQSALLIYAGGNTVKLPEQLIPHPGVAIITAALADVDGDGLTDVLVVPAGLSEVDVFTASATGLTSTAVLTLPFVPSALAAADVDGDGDLDFALVDGHTVKLFENTGGSLAPRYTATAADYATGLVFRDLDGDGHPDLAWVTTVPGTSEHRVQLRRAGAPFAFTAYEGDLELGTPASLSVGDLDADGDLDLAITYGRGGVQTATYLMVNRVR